MPVRVGVKVSFLPSPFGVNALGAFTENASCTITLSQCSVVQPIESTVADEVSGDDPLAALPALLARRSDCFRDLSELCLSDVDEHGSSAWEDDRAALSALVSQAQQPVLLAADDATLVQRLGDSALVSLGPGTEPASLLLLKGEAGWRIRDYLAGGDD